MQANSAPIKSSQPRRHFGGSILPSSDGQILQPMAGVHGTLQVKPLLEIESYGLFYTHEIQAPVGGAMQTIMASSMIASHPNGYSCHNLAQRILAAWSNPTEAMIDRALAQFDYILSCGGLGIVRGAMEYWIRPEQKGYPD